MTYGLSCELKLCKLPFLCPHWWCQRYWGDEAFICLNNPVLPMMLLSTGSKYLFLFWGPHNVGIHTPFSSVLLAIAEWWWSAHVKGKMVLPPKLFGISRWIWWTPYLIHTSASASKIIGSVKRGKKWRTISILTSTLHMLMLVTEPFASACAVLRITRYWDM